MSSMDEQVQPPDLVTLLGLALAPVIPAAPSTTPVASTAAVGDPAQIIPDSVSSTPNPAAQEDDDVSDNDGSETTKVKSTGRNQKANQRRKARKQLKRTREAELRSQGATQFLSAAYRMRQNQIHVFHVRKLPNLLVRLQALEVKRKAPLKMDDPEFPRDEVQWITGAESGTPVLRYVVDDVRNEVVLAVRITPWKSISPMRANSMQRKLTTAMDWSRAAPAIKNNGSQTTIKIHGTGESIKIPRRGNMHAVGWHHPYETNADVVFYAGNKAAADLYDETIKDLPALADMYREHFFYLLPGAAQEMVNVSEDLDIPSFSQVTLDGDDPERPFANCLTLTNGDFANALHQDNDFNPLAFGMWWVTGVRNEGRSTAYEFDDKLDHDSVEGGAFLLGEYGIGVDFER
ncbi:hypothetical protein EIP91_011525, partial [Steccherinum ochraceum]